MFKNREDAAQQLIEALKKYEWSEELIVVGLPRGGVPVAGLVAKALDVPLELAVPRKISSPQNEEISIGALSETGEIIWNEVEHAFLEDDWIEGVKSKELAESRRRRTLYGCKEKILDLKRKDVLIIDDGMSTGLTMRAALATVKNQDPHRISIAVPVAPIETIDELKTEVDRLICLETPHPFMVIGSHYESFPQVSDEEVIKLMKPHCNLQQ